MNFWTYPLAWTELNISVWKNITESSDRETSQHSVAKNFKTSHEKRQNVIFVDVTKIPVPGGGGLSIGQRCIRWYPDTYSECKKYSRFGKKKNLIWKLFKSNFRLFPLQLNEFTMWLRKMFYIYVGTYFPIFKNRKYKIKNFSNLFFKDNLFPPC